jgi:hypothetical protein
MPAGAPAADRAVGSAVLLRRLYPNFDDIEFYWTSCLLIRGELYLDNVTGHTVLSFGYRNKHSWGVVIPKSAVFSDCWSMSINRSEVQDHITEMITLGFAKPEELDFLAVAERYTAIPTSPCASLNGFT